MPSISLTLQKKCFTFNTAIKSKFSYLLVFCCHPSSSISYLSPQPPASTDRSLWGAVSTSPQMELVEVDQEVA